MDDAAELLGDELARNAQMYLGHGGHILTFVSWISPYPEYKQHFGIRLTDLHLAH